MKAYTVHGLHKKSFITITTTTTNTTAFIVHIPSA
jgi:hypothetical protein